MSGLRNQRHILWSLSIRDQTRPLERPHTLSATSVGTNMILAQGYFWRFLAQGAVATGANHRQFWPSERAGSALTARAHQFLVRFIEHQDPC
jgi:hypothetical protein